MKMPSQTSQEGDRVGNSRSLRNNSVEASLFLELKGEVENLKKEVDEAKKEYATKEELDKKLDIGDSILAFGEKKNQEVGITIFQKTFSDVPKFKFIKAIGEEHLTGFELSKRVGCTPQMIYEAINNYFKAGKRVTYKKSEIGLALQKLIHDTIIIAEKHKDIHGKPEHKICLSDGGKHLYGLRIFS